MVLQSRRSKERTHGSANTGCGSWHWPGVRPQPSSPSPCCRNVPSPVLVIFIPADSDFPIQNLDPISTNLEFPELPFFLLYHKRFPLHFLTTDLHSYDFILRRYPSIEMLLGKVTSSRTNLMISSQWEPYCVSVWPSTLCTNLLVKFFAPFASLHWCPLSLGCWSRLLLLPSVLSQATFFQLCTHCLLEGPTLCMFSITVIRQNPEIWRLRLSSKR